MKQGTEEAAETAKETTEKAASETRKGTEEAAESAKEATDKAASEAKRGTEKAAEATERTASKAKEGADELAETTEEATEETASRMKRNADETAEVTQKAVRTAAETGQEMARQFQHMTLDVPRELNVQSIGQHGLMQVMQLHTQLLNQALTVNRRLLDFARKRVDAELETGRRLAGCKEMAETVEVMTGFYKAAVEDYTQSAADLMQIGARSVEDTAENAKQGERQRDA